MAAMHRVIPGASNWRDGAVADGWVMEDDGELPAGTVDGLDWSFGYSGDFKGAPYRIERWRQAYEAAVDDYCASGDSAGFDAVRGQLCKKLVELVSLKPQTERDRDALMTAHALLHRMAVGEPGAVLGDCGAHEIETYLAWGVADGRDRFETMTGGLRREGTLSVDGDRAGVAGAVRPHAPRLGLGWGLAVRVHRTRAFYDRAVIWYLSRGDHGPIREARSLALGLMSFHLEQAARSEREQAAFSDAGAFLSRLAREFPEIDWPDGRRRRLARLMAWARAGGQHAGSETEA